MEDAPMPTEQEYQEQMRNFEINDRPPSFRHSRAFRNFKNPPQPHMCIRDKTIDGDQEVFINVMSWTRIVKPQAPNDPIPLYGGMRVMGASPRMPSSQRQEQQAQISPQNQAIIFAVMANPEVLKKASRNSVDDLDLIALVELMCEFVETMNPGLKLLRQPEVLKDRDLSGELKNIWGAVQAKREKEREQFMFTAGKHNPNIVVYTELGPDTAPLANNHPYSVSSFLEEAQKVPEGDNSTSGDYTTTMNGHSGDSPAVGEKNSNDATDSEDSLKKLNSHATSNNNHQSANSNSSGEDNAVIVGKEEVAASSVLSSSSPSIDHNNLINISKSNNHHNGSDRLKDTSSDSCLIEVPHHNDNDDPIAASASVNAQNDKKSSPPTTMTTMSQEKSSAEELKAPPQSPVVPLPATTTKMGNGGGGGKAEKEVVNEKKKEKSISGFLHNGLFGKRNKDKDKDKSGDKEEKATTKKESKPKLGSFKSKLLLSSSKEKEDKGSEANAKKVLPAVAALEANMNALNLRGGEETNNSTFNEIGQSMTTAK